MLRLIRFVALALVIVLGAVWAMAWFGRAPGEGLADAFVRRLASFSGTDMPAPSAGGVQLAQVPLGGAFALTDQAGRAVTEQTYAQGFSLIYFGFTFCPDVCPTELGVMASAMELLGPDSARVTPIFITVDPERDTPPVMADYVSRFDERLVGLTGTPEQIRQAARAFRVYFAKVTPPNASAYLMDHSSLVYLTGPDGRVRQVFRAETGPEAMAAAIRGQLRVARPS
ncbi:SCO family protein [Plastoroseomonas arctica]|uniref:SCO family protein n=1 Tax=Plastoroseomonas arctica TaxID=1509237 RepID=A0AAF1KK19_9PROT|nr:SCO family protein [Plastoroseomonas arctica]MBR0656205.1 SCO family protein [Plastoroseomonas arctica]